MLLLLLILVGSAGAVCTGESVNPIAAYVSFPFIGSVYVNCTYDNCTTVDSTRYWRLFWTGPDPTGLVLYPDGTMNGTATVGGASEILFTYSWVGSGTGCGGSVGLTVPFSVQTGTPPPTTPPPPTPTPTPSPPTPVPTTPSPTPVPPPTLSSGPSITSPSPTPITSTPLPTTNTPTPTSPTSPTPTSTIRTCIQPPPKLNAVCNGVVWVLSGDQNLTTPVTVVPTLVVGNLNVSTELTYTPTDTIPINVTGCVDLINGILSIQGDCKPRISVISSGAGCSNTPFSSVKTTGYTTSQQWEVTSGGQTLSIVSRCPSSPTTTIVASSVGGGIGILLIVGIGVVWYLYTHRLDTVHGTRDDVGYISRGGHHLRVRALEEPLLSGST